MKNNKKIILLSILLVLIIIGVAIGLSYAYFATIEDNDANIDVDTEITTQSNVVFNPGETIELINAEPGAYSETEFSISLTAPNKTPDAITYKIIWDITENTFEYDPVHGNPQLTYSLYYKTVEEGKTYEDVEWGVYVEDADCTTWKVAEENPQPIVITDSVSLTANTNETSTAYWKFKLEYKSYDYDQSINMGKSFSGLIKLDSEGI